MNETYDYGDYLLIRNGNIIAVAGNTEFYTDFDKLDYQEGDTIAKVITINGNLYGEELA